MWLLLESCFMAMESAQQGGFVITSEHRQELVARGYGHERISAKHGNVANIEVKGVLTQEPDIMALLYGGGNTTYPEIISAIAEANANDSIQDITMYIDSPGGSVDGMFQAMDAIRNSPKPITVIGGGVVASAAYGLASQASKITASHRSSMFGSIGTAASFFVSENIVDIASDNAPNKRPDVKTTEGVAAVKDYLNQVADMFDSEIAAGRDTTVKKINADFGKGGMLMAEAAEKQGMIDAVTTQSTVSASALSITQEAITMDLITLKAEHPAVYAEAMAEGAKQEKGRVSAHLSSGVVCGDLSIAIKAINEDTDYGDALTAAAYQNANMKNQHAKGNASDESEIEAVANGSTAPATPETDASAQETADEKALAAIEATMGTGESVNDFLFTGGAE